MLEVQRTSLKQWIYNIKDNLNEHGHSANEVTTVALEQKLNLPPLGLMTCAFYSQIFSKKILKIIQHPFCGTKS